MYAFGIDILKKKHTSLKNITTTNTITTTTTTNNNNNNKTIQPDGEALQFYIIFQSYTICLKL